MARGDWLVALGSKASVRRIVRRALLPSALVAIWWLASRREGVMSIFLPAPGQVLEALVTLGRNGDLARHALSSLRRLAMGYGLAASLGLGIGLLIGAYPWFEDAVAGTLEFLRPVPPIAIIPFAILWLGIGDAPKVLIVAYGAFFPILVNTIAGVKGVDRTLIRVARLVSRTRLQILARVILPAAMPQIFAGLRTSLGISFVLLLASEMVAANSGLGFLVLDAERMYRTDYVLAGIIAISGASVAADYLLRRIERRVLAWHISSCWTSMTDLTPPAR